MLLIISTAYCDLSFSEEIKTINLENKILSLTDKGDGKFDAEAFVSAVEEIDSFPIDQVTILLIRLSDYYLGEGGTGLYLEKVTKTGDKILPRLVQKRNTPTVACKNEYKTICRTIEERNLLIDRAIKAIKDGIVLYSVYPEKLKDEAEQYLKILDVFIEDYKRHKGNFPKSLQGLKEYSWIRYGYKIKILNPWGNPYKYILKGNKYVIEIGEE